MATSAKIGLREKYYQGVNILSSFDNSTTLAQTDLGEELRALRRADQWRECVILQSAPGPRIIIEGRSYLHLCSNNYLDLASHPAVVQAAQEAAARWGAGSGASRLVTGTSQLAADFEHDLAEFKQTEAALIFASGYLANLGLIPALAGRGDWLICDQYNHASLIDACRLSRAEIRVYPHGDAEAAGRMMAEIPAGARKVIVTDGIFSMQGDAAPLEALNALAAEHGAWLVVDDAHGTGVYGPEGRGACAASAVNGARVIQVFTFSKALGAQGGAVAGSREVIDLLVNKARSFIFETALAPPAMAAARAALGVICGESRDHAGRRENLLRNIRLLRDRFAALGFDFPESETPILPLVIGENAPTLEAAAELKARGYWITAIRPPTVPSGAACLRVTVMATHERDDLERFAADAQEILSRKR